MVPMKVRNRRNVRSVSAKAGLIQLKEGGVPLGMMPDMTYESGEVTLNSGDLVFMFTDGVTEAVDEREELWGDEALERCLKGSVGLDLNNVIHDIQVEVRAHAGDVPYEDDVTIVALQRLA